VLLTLSKIFVIDTQIYIYIIYVIGEESIFIKMVKQKPSANLDRNMNAYKMRTPYGGLKNHSQKNHSQQNPSKPNHVQVAHSNGCCSPKKTHNIPSQPVVIQPVVIQQPQTPRQTAHEKSHSRLDSPDPFYYRRSRIRKNPNRTKKPHQQQHGKNQIHSTGPTINQRQTNQNHQSVEQTNHNYPPVQQTTPKKNSCCTIL
jgi:hypothetical protein